MNKLVFLVPTYNESVSIVELLEKLREFRTSADLGFDVIVIDDNSPDGTADKVES